MKGPAGSVVTVITDHPRHYCNCRLPPPCCCWCSLLLCPSAPVAARPTVILMMLVACAAKDSNLKTWRVAFVVFLANIENNWQSTFLPGEWTQTLVREPIPVWQAKDDCIFIQTFLLYHTPCFISQQSFRVELGVTIKTWAPADMLYMSYECWLILVLLNEKKILLTDTHSHVQTVECKKDLLFIYEHKINKLTSDQPMP